ncbi:hypothetical protein PybrP1_005461 [[Pythium] brassicae (nom. inval.)]|nr:hypothetical protein PybrP1_005461 [[Pythium] brassicae (nom. inval.)]
MQQQQPERPFQSGVQVFIPAALNRPSHTLYSICMVVQPTAQEWTVNRRYSQFLTLKKELLAALAQPARCPGCASYHVALAKFPFPPKAMLRTNSVVRRRVAALQDFLKLLAERTFNDLPKCVICGDEAKKMLRPFLIRGAQPIGPSIVSKIQQSLSLSSFAYVPRTIPGPGGARSDASSDDEYAKRYGDERCTDSKVSLDEAVKNVVLPRGVSATYEEVLMRLSSMWDAYEDMDAVLASIPPERLSKRLSATAESVDEVTF